MHCVYNAFDTHMTAIGEPNYLDVWYEYLKQKQASHGNNPYQRTFAGVLPWLYWQMLWQHNLRSSQNVIEMKMERSYITLPEYMPDAQNRTQRDIMLNRTQYWGRQVDQITLAPAIYCLLNEQHAQFLPTVPDRKGTRIIMAFQFVVAHKE